MTRFIAEIGSNHNRDLDRCLALVDAAADAGCRAVKVQLFRVDDLFAPEILAARPDLLDRRAWELPLSFLPALRERCDERRLELGAAAFGLWAVDELAPWIDWVKVASYELLWHDLVRACAAIGKPLILSTGMATLDEVEASVYVARDAGASVSLLHCVSSYPTPRDQANLAAIDSMRTCLGCPVGWSDHTNDPSVVVRAVRRWGATDVELHIDLDGAGAEAGAHSWTPARIAVVIAAASSAEAVADRDDADGDGVKRPMPTEQHDVAWRTDPVDGLRPLREMRAAYRAYRA